MVERCHRIETGWSDTGDMRATCRRCWTYFEAQCEDSTSYIAVRHAQQEARKPFADYDCFDAIPPPAHLQ